MIQRNYIGLFAEEMDALTDVEYLAYERDNADELKRIRALRTEMRKADAAQDAAAFCGDDHDVLFMNEPEIAVYNAARLFEHGEPWGADKTEAEIEAEVDRRLCQDENRDGSHLDNIWTVIKLDEPGLAWYSPEEFQVMFHPSDDCRSGHACPSIWHVLEFVREQDNYQEVRASLHQLGWVRPLPWRWYATPPKWGPEKVRELVDGHTRAAAAIELGIKIPLVEVTIPAMSADSGRWREGERIATNTRDALYPSLDPSSTYPWATRTE